MSMGGLFIETPEPKAEGVLARLNFLVQEGQIRADAVVRHATPGVGLGLKFTALSEQDRPKLAALLTRLRGYINPAKIVIQSNHPYPSGNSARCRSFNSHPMIPDDANCVLFLRH